VTILDRLSRRRPAPESPPSPFVVGVTRSGTTLLRLMLDAHPQLAVPPETHFLPDLISTCKTGPVTADRCTQAIVSHRRWPDFQLDADELRERLRATAGLDVTACARGFYELYAERAGKERWGDKTPGYLRRMRTIAKVLPEARFVHLIRDGRDVAVSITALHFGADTVRQAAERWVKRIDDGRAKGARVSHYLEIRYEDLVLEPEPTLRQICDYVELPWDPRMLDYHSRAGDRLTEITRDLPRSDQRDEDVIPAAQRVGIHALAQRPPQADRVGRWRSELSADDQAVFSQVAGELLEELGYPAQ